MAKILEQIIEIDKWESMAMVATDIYTIEIDEKCTKTIKLKLLRWHISNQFMQMCNGLKLIAINAYETLLLR